MTTARVARILGDPSLMPYLVSHLGKLVEARKVALDLHDRRHLRTLDAWLAEHDVVLDHLPLGPVCVGLSLIVDGESGILVSSRIRSQEWRNAIAWHELAHLLTGTARSVLCRPDDWLTSRLERLAWCAGAIYAVSAFEAVQIGWNLTTVEAIAKRHEIPVELVMLRYALGVRDREIPLLRLPGSPMVERALRDLTARCRSLVGMSHADIEYP